MYLFPPDHKLLNACKHAQMREDKYVFVYPTSNKVSLYHLDSFYHEHVDAALNHDPDITIRIPDYTSRPTLNSLVSNGLLNRVASGDIYQVTHLGWYNNRLEFSTWLKLVITNVLFPAIVAFITTVLTLFLNGFIEK